LKPVFLHTLVLISTLLYCDKSISQAKKLLPNSKVLSRISVSSNFDCGSIDTLEIFGNSLSGKTKHWKQTDNIGDQYYWFYFKLDNVLNKTVNIELNNLIGNYRGTVHTVYDNRTQPVYSYDNIHWERIKRVNYTTKTHSFTFNETFKNNQVWIAYAHPYTFSKEVEFIDLVRSKPNIKIAKIGNSRELRDINLLTITDESVSDSKKKVVFITALQHAGEYPGGFIVEGMVNYLLSEGPVPDEVRKKTIFKIVPMLNPDGIYHGMTRYNAANEDLNAEWDDDITDTIHAPVEPEVACVKEWLRDWFKQGRTIDIHIDLHSQSQQGGDNVMHMPVEGMLRDFCNKLNKYFQMNYIPMEFYGSATNMMNKEFHVPTTVFEITQSSIGEGPYLTIDDYKTYGEGIVKAFHDYIQSGGNGN
jgi:hypothetical protein